MTATLAQQIMPGGPSVERNAVVGSSLVDRHGYDDRRPNPLQTPHMLVLAFGIQCLGFGLSDSGTTFWRLGCGLVMNGRRG